MRILVVLACKDLYYRKGCDYLIKGDDCMKQRSFVMKYQDFYSIYNSGKSHKQRKKNRILGNKRMRNKLNRLMRNQCCDN
jgi:hypothetical protein